MYPGYVMRTVPELFCTWTAAFILANQQLLFASGPMMMQEQNLLTYALKGGSRFLKRIALLAFSVNPLTKRGSQEGKSKLLMPCMKRVHTSRNP
jgi:hypothetical protein